jgi:hypothetical protein
MKLLAELLLYTLFLSFLPVWFVLLLLGVEINIYLLIYAVAIVVAGGLWLLGHRPRA